MVRLPTPEINRSGGRGEWQDRMTTPSMASPNCTAESRGTRFATLGRRIPSVGRRVSKRRVLGPVAEGCYRQLSAKPSNPSGLQEDYRPYDRRVPAFPVSAGRQNRVYGSATTRFRRTGSILPGRFQFLGKRKRVAGDSGLHQPVSQICVPSSRPPVLSIIGVTPASERAATQLHWARAKDVALLQSGDANQLAA
jgi:hypothetical protein